MSNCKTRLPGRVATTADLYAIFLPLLFFIPFLHAMWKAREKTECSGRKIHYVPPTAFRVAIEEQHSLNVYQMRRVNPRIIREAEHRLNEETE